MKYNLNIIPLIAIILAGTPSLGFTQEPLSELQKAMKSQNGELVQAILQSFNTSNPETRSEVTKVDENSRTALMLAIRDGMGFRIINRLLSLGADLTQSDIDGKTPLFYAASKGHLDLTLGMIKRGSKINHTDRFGWTPLGQIIMAITNEQEQFKALKAFLKAEANPEFQFPNDPDAYPNRKTFDRLNSRSLLTWAIESRSEHLTRVILDHMKNQSSNPSWVNGVDGRGRTALIQAVESGQFELAQDLIERGALVTVQDNLGWTALTKLLTLSSNNKAFQLEQIKWMKVFLEQSGKVEQSFPTIEAAYLNKKGYEKFRGRSILAWAVENSRTDVIALLLEHGSDLGPLEPLLMSSIERGNMEMLTLVVQQGAELCPREATHLSGHTPLTLAAEKGKFEVMNLLLNSISKSGNAPISQELCDLNTLGKDGKTALGWAGAKGNLKLAQLIVEKGESQFLGIPDFMLMLTSEGSPMLKGKWVEFFTAIQLPIRLADLLNLKSESVIAFEGDRLESENPGFLPSVDALKSLMNQKAKELYYQEREQEIYRDDRAVMDVDRSDSDQNQAGPSLSRSIKRLKIPEIQDGICIYCGDAVMGEDNGAHSGPASCACNYLCSDCTKSDFVKKVINLDGEELSRCVVCKKLVTGEFLRTNGANENDLKKVRNRIVDLFNSKQLGWIFCPTQGCAGGRVVQPHEGSAYYSCILCGHEGCIKCGNEHKGDCANYEKEMKEFENLLRLGAMAPPEHQPTDPDHADYLKGRFRPCYHCGVVTERSDGCTHMKCTRCMKEWRWNLGPYNRNYDYNKLPMQFTPLQPPHF